MYPPGGPRQPEINFEQILVGLRTTLGGIARRLGGGGVGLLVSGVIALILIIWVATGVYQINPGEAAALRLFGDVQGNPVEQTGLHWWWPAPIGKMDK